MSQSAGFKPFMEYAGSYALFNYRLQDPSKGLEYDNLRLIRAFEHGLDPTSSEAGFVLVHVDMVQNSGPLVDGVVTALDACAKNDRESFDTGMEKVVQAMVKVNKVMDGNTLLSKNALSTTNTNQACGAKANPTTTSPSAPSSSASQAKACSPMVSSTKASPKNPSPSAASREQTTA